MRFLPAFLFDVRYQLRYGFYYAYLFVCALYVIVLRSLPLSARGITAAVLVFSDTSVMGYFFIGSIILLERNERTIDSVFVSPLSIAGYLCSKVASLTLLSLLASSAVYLFGLGFEFRLIPLCLAVFLSSVFFTLLGIALGSRARSLNEFILSSILYLFVFFVPILDILGLWRWPPLRFLPTGAVLTLLGASLAERQATALIVPAAVLVLWCVPAFFLAKRWFERFVVRTVGESLCVEV